MTISHVPSSSNIKQLFSHERLINLEIFSWLGTSKGCRWLIHMLEEVYFVNYGQVWNGCMQTILFFHVEEQLPCISYWDHLI